MVKYYVPKNIDDALLMLNKGNYLPYAGGTDINSDNSENKDLLFIGKLPELREIIDDGQYIRIGAAVTYAKAEENELIPEIMKSAIHKLAGPAVRNVGTFGGNLANGSGKADSALVDLVLDAKIRIRSFDKERFVNATNFYHGRKNVDLLKNELICEILIPKRDYLINFYYDKISVRSSMAISNISIASVWNIKDNIIKNLAIGIGSATEYPLRCTNIEEEFIGKSLEYVEKICDEKLAEYASNLELQPDRTSVNYRRLVCYRLLYYLVHEEFTPIKFD